MIEQITIEHVLSFLIGVGLVVVAWIVTGIIRLFRKKKRSLENIKSSIMETDKALEEVINEQKKLYIAKKHVEELKQVMEALENA